MGFITQHLAKVRAVEKRSCLREIDSYDESKRGVKGANLKRLEREAGWGTTQKLGL